MNNVGYDPFITRTPHFYDHVEDVNTDQESVTTITGDTETESGKETEVEMMVNNRHIVDKADSQLRSALRGSRKPAERTVPQAGEVIFKSVYCRSGVPTQLAAYNYDRSRILVSGRSVDAAGLVGNVAVGDSACSIPFSITNPPGNYVVIGYSNTYFLRSFNTVRDLWAITDQDLYLSVQEEFFS